MMKTNSNQQHKDDTIPCAQAALTVCDCMKYISSSTICASAWAKKLWIHQSFYELIQFVKDLEIFDHAKLLTFGIP